MPDPVEVVSALALAEQQTLACALAGVVDPYGAIERTVVEPELYRQLSGRLGTLHSGDSEAASRLAEDCRRIIDRYDDEPDGAGFYAFGAVVSVYYASRAVAGEITAGINAVKRFLDLVGCADDDGETGLHDEGIRYVLSPSTKSRDALRARVASHAISMRHGSGAREPG